MAAYIRSTVEGVFVETKAVAGCRPMDLAGVESSQLRDGRLYFRPDLTKGRGGVAVSPL